MSGIFISYRRADSEGYVGRLSDHLLKYYDKKQIFLDVDSIKPGKDFEKAIKEKLKISDVLLAVIGTDWVNSLDKNGNLRLNDPNDYVRLEISIALKINMLVIPVLVKRAQMPDIKQLPEELRPLLKNNAIEISHDRFEYDVTRLMERAGLGFGRVNVSFRKRPKQEPAIEFRVHTRPRPHQSERQQEFRIEIDGELVGVVSKSKSFSMKIEPGVHKFELLLPEWKSKYKVIIPENRPRIPKNKAEFNLKSGQTIIFEIEPRFKQDERFKSELITELFLIQKDEINI